MGTRLRNYNSTAKEMPDIDLFTYTSLNKSLTFHKDLAQKYSAQTNQSVVCYLNSAKKKRFFERMWNLKGNR